MADAPILHIISTLSLLETFQHKRDSLVNKKIKRFGEKLHTLRLKRGLTLKALAQLLGHASHSYISELESGKKCLR
ncbi:MAG: helix-turn-helix domain-containing protein [Armatimonadetes bacterium]|nr:helix-turn-helix domain-containing protein [Armatimonadota bacterium]